MINELLILSFFILHSSLIQLPLNKVSVSEQLAFALKGLRLENEK